MKGQPRKGWLLSEAWQIAKSQPLASMLIFLVASTVMATALGTVGRTEALERSVLSTVENPASRTITFSAVGETRFDEQAVERLAALSGVTAVIGLGEARDVRNHVFEDAGEPVAVWSVFGSEAELYEILEGRRPGPGEMVVGREAQRRLGLNEPFGEVRSDTLLERLPDSPTMDLPVVGSFSASQPFGFLEAGGLTPGESSGARVRTLYVTVASISIVPTATQEFPNLLGVDRQELEVESSEEFAEIELALTGQLGTYSRSLLVAVISVGAVLIAAATLAVVMARARDFGRRRALGASRSALVAMASISAVLPAVLGMTVGTIVGSIYVMATASSQPPMSFVLGTALLGLDAVILAVLIPAVAAAFRDPVRALRVP